MIYMGSLAAFLAVLILTPLMRKAARRMEFMDEPGGRKQHEKPVPPIGGLVIFPVFMGVSLLTGIDVNRYGLFFAALLVLLVTGSLDDKKQIHPWTKFLVQVAVSAAVVLSGEARIFQLGDLFGLGDIGLDFMSIPFSIAAVALLINAVNLMDGLDGLAAGYSAIVLFWLIFASAVAGQWIYVPAMAVLLAAVLGFLVFNLRNPLRRKAAVFLGDAGSMGLGLALAWFCIALAQQKQMVLAPISVAWILAIPIIDICAQFYRRILEGRHPFAPDRGHFHHHFIHAGIPPGEATAAILSLGFILGAAGYLAVTVGVPPVILTLGWIAMLLAHMALSQNPDVYIRLFSRVRRKDAGT